MFSPLRKYLCFAGMLCLLLISFGARGQCPPIQGQQVLCEGATITLSSTGGAGTWLSANTSVATVAGVGGAVAASAVVYGVASGPVVIVFSAAGCGASAISITVNNTSPSVIGGGLASCVGEFVPLSNSAPGGIWASSNTTVAAVASNGDMTTHAMGTSVISYNTGCGAAATRTVTINSRPPLNIFGATVNALASEAYMCPGATIVLSNDGIPTGTWTSSNSAAATINANTGVITSSGMPGTTVITTMNSCLFVTRFVNVQIGNPVITGNTLVCTGGSTQLSGGISPGTWSSGNTSLATVYPSSGAVFASGSGTGAVPITFTYAGGCSATTTVTVNSAVAPITGPRAVCVGGTIALSNAVAGGSWTSSNTTRATVNAATGIATGVAPGMSVISYTTSCGVTTATVSVEVSPGPISGTVGPCVGYFALLTNSVPGGVWSSSNTAVGTMAQTGNLYTFALGTTVISYTNSCGVATRTVTITSKSPLMITGNTVDVLSAKAYLCIGASTTLSNDGIPTGTWSSSNSAVAVVNTVTGVVTSTGGAGTTVITAANVCNTVARYVTLYVNNPTPIAGNLLLCGNTTTLSNGVSPGTWSSGNTALATVEAVAGIVHRVPGVTSGSLLITYTYAGGCSVTATLTLAAPPAAITGATGVCAGNTISLSNSTTGGTWSSSNTTVATISPGGAVAGVGTGIAVITYTTGCGQVTTTITVGAPLPAISGNTRLCGVLSTTLSNAISPGTWSSGNTSLATIEPATGVVHVVPGGGNGTVPITYTTAGGCAAQATLTVTTSMSAITGYGTICAGATIALSNASPGGTWTSGNTAVATIDINTGVATGVSNGIIVITYTSDCGLATASLTVSALPAIAGPVMVCAGTTINLSIASAGGTWSSAATGIATVSAAGAVAGVSSGVTTITYTAGIGCVATKTIAVNPVPGPITAPSILCAGFGGLLGNSAGGGTWSSNNTVVSIAGNNVTGNIAGVSVITYALPGGCFETATITVSPPPGVITGSTTVCAGAATMLSNAVPGGMWASASTSVATIDVSGLLTGVAPGVALVTYATGAGCMVTATITVLPLPDAGVLSGPGTVCEGGQVALSNSVGGGAWSSSTTIIATVDAGGLVSGAGAGVATISYTISSLCGNASAMATVTVVAMPVAGDISGPDSVCVGSTIALSDDEPGGVWGCTAGVATVSNTGVVAGLSAGTVEVSYTITNACGSAVATATITVNALPEAGIISGPDSLCKGADVVLSASVSGGVWSSNNASIATVAGNTGSMHVLTEGVVIISYAVTSSAGCIAVATHTVLVTPSLFGLGVVMTPVSCYGATDGGIATYITGTKPTYEYLWSTGATTPAVSGVGAGSYALHVESPQTRCAIDTSFTLAQPDSISIEDSSLYDLCNRGTGKIMLTVTGGTGAYSYLWSTNATAKDLEQLHAGIYSVTVTDINNCTEQHWVEVADSACSAIVIHDVITPNGDGYNDAWVIEGIQGYPGCMVQVFDKWGDKVFEKQGYQNDWSGQGRNGLLPDGTYYYLVKLNNVNVTGGADTFTGYIMIKR